MTNLSVLYLSVCTLLPIPSSPAENEITILYHTDPSLSVCQGGLFRFCHAYPKNSFPHQGCI